MTRIVYLHQHFRLPSEAGGGRPWQLTQRLATEGYDVHLIAGATESRDLDIQGVHVHYLKAPFSTSGTLPVRLAQAARFALSAIARSISLKPDLIYASSTPLTTVVPALVANRLRGTPYVFEVRDVWPAVLVRLGLLTNPALIRAAETLERWAYARASHVVALSQAMADDIRQVEGTVPITVIPNASDVDATDPVPMSERDLSVIYAGSLNTTYDGPWISQFMAALATRGVTNIRVLGGGAGLSEVQNRMRSIGLDPQAVAPGPIPKAEVFTHLRRAKLSLSSLMDNPALEGNSLNKVFDSLATGTPIIFNHAGWLHDSVVPPGAGWRVPRDPGAAAELVSDILGSPDLLEQGSRTASRLAHDTYSRDQTFATLKQVLAQTLEGPRLTKWNR